MLSVLVIFSAEKLPLQFFPGIFFGQKMTKTGCMTRCKPYSILQFRMDLMCYNCFFAKFRMFILVNGQKSVKSLFLVCTCEISQKSSYSTLNPYGTAKCYKVCIWSCYLFWSSFHPKKIPGKNCKGSFSVLERGGLGKSRGTSLCV